MNLVRLSLAASALVFSGALLAQTGGSATEGAAPGSAQTAAPAATAAPAPGAGPHRPMARDGRAKRHHSEFMPGMDANRDGQITRDELQAAQKRQLERFEQIDTNHDGVVTRDELQAARESRREQHSKQMSERRAAAKDAPAQQAPASK